MNSYLDCNAMMNNNQNREEDFKQAHLSQQAGWKKSQIGNAFLIFERRLIGQFVKNSFVVECKENSIKSLIWNLVFYIDNVDSGFLCPLLNPIV